MVKDGTTNTLSPNSMQYKAGIRVPASASLCILGSSGKLNVTGGGHSAGIGGDYMAASGEIVINGSIVTARITSYNVCYTKLLRPIAVIIPPVIEISPAVPAEPLPIPAPPRNNFV